jgi:hypothetical protein
MRDIYIGIDRGKETVGRDRGIETEGWRLRRRDKGKE